MADLCNFPLLSFTFTVKMLVRLLLVFLLLNSVEGQAVNAACALYVLHSFHPAKHTTLIQSKARNIPERALVSAYEARERVH